MLLRGKYDVLINVTWDCFDQSNFYISRNKCIVFTCWKQYSPGDVISIIVFVIKQLQTFVSVNMSFY